MKNDDGFIYEEPEGLSEQDEDVLKGLKHQKRVDPVTGRVQKRVNILNKKQLSQHEMDEFFMDL